MVVDWENTSAFRIWPNPTHGSFSLLVDADASVTVSDMSGGIVYRRELTAEGGRIDIVLPEPVTAGIYMVTVETKNGVQTGKLLVL
jgi:hypothetical protein